MKNRLSHKPAPLNIPAQKEDNSNQLKRSTTQVSNKQSNNHSNELVVPYPVKSPISRSIHCFDYIKEQQKQKTIKKKKKNEKPSPEMKAGDEIRNILLKSSSPLPKPTQKWDDIEDEHGLRSAPARYSQHGSEFEGSEFEPCWLVRDTPPAGVDHIRDQATFTPPIPRPSNPIPEDQQFPNHSNVSSSQFNVNFNNNNNVHSSSYSSSPAQQRIGAELGLLRFSPPCEPIPSNIKSRA
eukprot:gb/GECH01012207.1/.p1 GENE.gb/GECH01012207.1/~~gb/GECH01012207.1/.p1  ORF type:complete len:238 (+),score=76.23 gb/GECH01012207.1/:1-714(+)